jgi:23S rRNA (uracil1939-C5)-methyltransferase
VEDSGTLTVTIDRPVAGGWMLARHEGRTVLVSGAIPGEQVKVAVRRVQRTVAWAEVTEVLESSADRRPVSFDPACGGSLYAHIRYERQLRLKSEVIADAFRRIGKIELTAPVAVTASPEHAYRLRARLHVQRGRIGFYREGTHEICDAGPTQQLHAGAIAALTELPSLLGRRISDCDSVIVAENVTATQRLLHLVPRPGVRLDQASVSIDAFGHATGITTDVGKRQIPLAGESTTTDTAADLFGSDPPIPSTTTWTRTPASFFQANRFLVGALLRSVLDALIGDRCVDLYSGVGLFAVAMAASGRKTLAVEGDPVSARDLAANAAPWRDHLRVAHAAVETFVDQPLGRSPDVVVLDPPRSGASPEVITGILAWRPTRIVYVSCDPPTLARDLARLKADGYELIEIRGFDLFPNTPHVETVAVCARL